MDSRGPILDSGGYGGIMLRILRLTKSVLELFLLNLLYELHIGLIRTSENAIQDAYEEVRKEKETFTPAYTNRYKCKTCNKELHWPELKNNNTGLGYICSKCFWYTVPKNQTKLLEWIGAPYGVENIEIETNEFEGKIYVRWIDKYTRHYFGTCIPYNNLWEKRLADVLEKKWSNFDKSRKDWEWQLLEKGDTIRVSKEGEPIAEVKAV